MGLPDRSGADGFGESCELISLAGLTEPCLILAIRKNGRQAFHADGGLRWWFFPLLTNGRMARQMLRRVLFTLVGIVQSPQKQELPICVMRSQ